LTVLAAFYTSDAAASKALGAMQTLDQSGDVRFLAAATIVRDTTSTRLKIGETIESRLERPSAERPRGLIESIFPPAILALEAIGGAAKAAEGHFADQGFQANLLKELGENMPPGGSALVAVIEEKWVERLGDIFAGYADFERFTLEPDAAARLRTASGRNA
jgi:uncharacterized membrane protein